MRRKIDEKLVQIGIICMYFYIVGGHLYQCHIDSKIPQAALRAILSF